MIVYLNKIESFYKCIVLLFTCCLLNEPCSAQNNDDEIKNIYLLQLADKNYSFILVKVKQDEAASFENNFYNKIYRKLNKQWFVIKAVDTALLKQFSTVEVLPANNKFKLSAPGTILKLNPSGLYTFIVSVSDSAQLKADLQSYHQQIQSSYKNAFLIKARPSFISDTLINKDYIRSVSVKLQQPKPETVINEYDNSTNAVNLFFSNYPAINGNSLTASVKENLFDTTDIDFKNRVVKSPIEATELTSHATTMATLIAGGGNSFESSKGIASAASLSSSDFANLLPDDDSYFNQYKISVQNNSYGVGVENFYGADAAAYDESTIDNPYLLYVFSAGNSGNVAPVDGNYKGIEGFSNLTGSFKQAKNILTVGSVDSFYNVAALSSKGPAYDGRIKPELVAYGNDGSSGAAAITSGTVLAVQSAYQSVHHDSLPPNALTKAIIINSADDVFNPGPDYYSGYGNVNTNNAVADALSNQFFTGDAQQSGVKSFTVHVPANTSSLKITLVWNDPVNQANAFTALINDLDLTLENVNDHSVYQPWILNANADGSTLLNNAVRGRDSLNNVEQITISKPATGNYIIHVKGYNVTTGAQSFYVVYTLYAADSFTFISPVSNTHFISTGKAIFRWNSTFTANKGKLEYSIDKGNSWRLLSSNIDLSQKYFKWIAPDTNTIALARMTINNKTFYSDTFDISTQPYPAVGFNCDDSALIYWNKQKDVSQYKIFSLGDKFMQPIATVNDTFYVVKNPPSKYIAVAPVIENHTAIRSYTFDYSSQGIGCYISNFLADPDNENASLKLFLGTTFNVKNVVFQQLLSDTWLDLQTVEPVNSLTVNYSTPMHKGINFFRAVVTLEDGATVVSNQASVDYTGDAKYIIFPNPVASAQGFYILSQNISVNTIVLFDVLGRKVLQQKVLQQQQHIITSKLTGGVYFVVFYDDNKHVVFKTKLIIHQ